MKTPKVIKPVSCQSMCQKYKECYIHYTETTNDNCLMYGYINGTTEGYGYPKLRKLTHASTNAT